MRSSLRYCARCIAVAALVLAVAPVAQAQVVRVVLRDSITAAPVVGVLVSALDSAGQRRADGLSGDAGTVSLRLPAAGTWTITIRRIGVRPKQVTGVQVAVGETRALTLALASMKQFLPPVRVLARTTCGSAPVGDDRTGALWEQVSLALRAATITQRELEALPPLRVVERTNVLSTSLQERESVITRDAIGTGRMVQADDADTLAMLGYIRQEEDGSTLYFAPDEQVLLSDSFLATHCFSTPKRDASALFAELQFKPVRGRQVADVEGTAYVDVNTGELRRISYRYAASRTLLPSYAEHAGGDVHLHRLANGNWIVSRWSIRMPVFGRIADSTQLSVTGYLEFAGVVQELHPNLPTPPPER